MEEVGLNSAEAGSLAQPRLPEAERLLDLLVITDQINSSKHTVAQLKDSTAEHFRSFLDLLAKHRALRNEENTYVVKNIGDSLMLRIACKPSDVASLLREIALCQRRLVRRPEGEILLRVFVMNLWERDKDYLIGEDIPFQAKADWTKLLPQGWLKSDLFGPKINLAFRATHLPAEKPILVVAEQIVTEIQRAHTIPTTSAPFTLIDMSFRFSERLPFSPFKGLEDYFKLGKQNLDRDWHGHLYLRSAMIDGDDEVEEEEPSFDALSREQQRYRVITRLMWQGTPQPCDIEKWRKHLEKFQRGAKYFRILAPVRSEKQYEVTEGVIREVVPSGELVPLVWTGWQRS
jgi:hypothetical protein